MSSGLENENSQIHFLRDMCNDDLKEFICRITNNTFSNYIKQLVLAKYPAINIYTTIREGVHNKSDIYLVINYTISSACKGHITFHLIPRYAANQSNSPIHVKNNIHKTCQKIRVTYTLSDNCTIKRPNIALSRSSMTAPHTKLNSSIADVADIILGTINRWLINTSTYPINRHKCIFEKNNCKKLTYKILTHPSRRGGTRKNRRRMRTYT